MSARSATTVSEFLFDGFGVNALIGNFNYQYVDGSLYALGEPLKLKRSYNEADGGQLPAAPSGQPGIPTYNETLGYGWTHNYALNLTLPEAPGGEAGTVILRAPHGSQIRFAIGFDGTNYTYTAYHGILAKLRQVNTGGVITYEVTAADQSIVIFNAAGVMQKMTDPKGYVKTFTYDGQNRLKEVIDAGTSNKLTLIYDANGLLTTVEDGKGRTAVYTYQNGDLKTAKDFNGYTWTYNYNQYHLLLEVVDPLGNKLARSEYDPLGRVLNQYDASNNHVLTLAFPDPQTTQITDALGNIRIAKFDTKGLLKSVTDASGKDLGKTFDKEFNLSGLTDPRGNTTQLAWDANSNLKTVTDPLNNVMQLAYDANNNLTQTTDALGRVTKFFYNGTLLDHTTDSLNNTTTYQYTTAADAPQPPGLLKTVTDPTGRVTTCVYNNLGQRITVTDPQGNITQYTYDAIGRVDATTDPLGRVTKSNYDTAGNLQSLICNFVAGQPQNYQNAYNLTVKLTVTMRRGD